MTRTIDLPPLFKEQAIVALDPTRFRVMACGRRFGKSLLASAIACQAASQGGRVWWVGPSWRQVDSHLIPAAIGEREHQLRVTRIVSRRAQRIVWSWYWIDGTFTTSPYLAKLLEAKSKLTGGDPRAAFVAISTELLEDLDSTNSLLHEFLGAMGPLHQALARVGSP